jgi:hypothetical protein
MAESKGARAMRHPIWDSHLAPRISTLELQKLVVLRKAIRPDPLQFVITAIALEFIPLKTRVQTFNFIRRAQVAFDEYALARGAYRKFFSDRNPVFYLDALHHFEVCLASAHQGHEALFEMTGGKFFDSGGQGRAELNWRMNRLYNTAKHASDFIKRASFKGDMLTAWISNDGLETRNEKMAFGELAEILDDMCLAASILAKSYIWRKVPVPNFWDKPRRKRVSVKQ